MNQEVVVHGDVPAVMRDGKTLMSDVYSPASGGPYPVLLTHLPNGSVGMQPPSLRSMAPGQTWSNHLNGVQWRGGLTSCVRGAFDRGVYHENFVARLVDVYPDARAIVVTDGKIRASARESYPAPGVIRPVQSSPVEPGRVYEYSVDMWQTAIPSSSFPRWDRNPNTGESSVYSAHTNVARQRIFNDPQRPSHITLSVVDR